MPHISAIVLAAGKSERMGRPKALLPLRGRTFIETILLTIGEAKVDNTVVVLGHHREEIRNVLQGVRFVVNGDYEKGMVTSIQAGIRALPEEADGALLFLVDHPLVSAATVNTLIDNFEANRIVLPKFESRRGHPVLFARSILDEIMRLPASTGANAVLWNDPSRVVEVPVNDRGINIDVDTPEQYASL